MSKIDIRKLADEHGISTSRNDGSLAPTLKQLEEFARAYAESEAGRLRAIMEEYAEADAAYDAAARWHGEESNCKEMRLARRRVMNAAKKYRAAIAPKEK